MIAGHSTAPARDKDRVPMNVHPQVRARLHRVLFEPELRGVGYSEFIDRAVATAEAEITQLRLRGLSKGLSR